MAEEHEHANIAKEWTCFTGKFNPTPEQKRRKQKTGSFYRRDEKLENYEVRKGRFV